jgi:hypothetical protein
MTHCSILRETNRANPTTWGKHGYGGNKRTVQLAELVASAGLQFNDISKENTTSRWERYRNGLVLLQKHKFEVKPERHLISKCGHAYTIYQRSLAEHRGHRVLLLEEPNHYIAYHAAKDHGYKILAVPHNLETFVIGYIDFFTGQDLPHCLEREIQHLSIADAVFCISREEQWLLKLRGISADFLPYYPPTHEIEQLLEIRNARAEIEIPKTQFLIIGALSNPATYQGMIEQLEWLAAVYQKTPFQVDIVGYGTENLKTTALQHPAFKIHGTVSPEQLHHLMTHAKAVLLHQSTGVGALTRIPEMLVAGIPIIANNHACRSAFGYSGVYCYDDQAELATLLDQTLPLPELLPRPVTAENRFIDCLKSMID